MSILSLFCISCFADNVQLKINDHVLHYLNAQEQVESLFVMDRKAVKKNMKPVLVKIMNKASNRPEHKRIPGVYKHPSDCFCGNGFVLGATAPLQDLENLRTTRKKLQNIAGQLRTT